MPELSQGSAWLARRSSSTFGLTPALHNTRPSHSGTLRWQRQANHVSSLITAMSQLIEGKFTLDSIYSAAEETTVKKTSNSRILDRAADERVPKFRLSGACDMSSPLRNSHTMHSSSFSCHSS